MGQITNQISDWFSSLYYGVADVWPMYNRTDIQEDVLFQERVLTDTLIDKNKRVREAYKNASF